MNQAPTAMTDPPDNLESSLDQLAQQVRQADAQTPADPDPPHSTDPQPQPSGSDNDDTDLLKQIDQLLSEQADLAIQGEFQSIDQLLSSQAEPSDQPHDPLPPSPEELADQQIPLAQAEPSQASPEDQSHDQTQEPAGEALADIIESGVSTDDQPTIEGAFQSTEQLLADSTGSDTDQEDEPQEQQNLDDQQLQTIDKVLDLSADSDDAAEQASEPAQPGTAQAVAEELDRDEKQSAATPPAQPQQPARQEPSTPVRPAVSLSQRLVRWLALLNRPFEKIPLPDSLKPAIGYLALGNCFMAVALILYGLLFR